MSEENIRNLDGSSFEERVFLRFDLIDARFDAIERRLEALETQAEKRALEAKPIFERALAEILEIRASVSNVERKLDVLSRDIIQVRADQTHAETRLEKLESRPTR